MVNFNSEINKLALKNFYENYKDEYFKRRYSGDEKLWDEQYKWDVLPKLNKELAKFDEITKENIDEFMSIITRNENKNNFVHWMGIEKLISIFNRKNSYQILNEIWSSDIYNVEKTIEATNRMVSFLAPEERVSPSTWSYILTAKDCSKFSLYNDNIRKEIIDINSPAEIKTLKSGEKYQLLNDSAIYLGELIQEDKGCDGPYSQTALNGQDFLWIVFYYIKKISN